MAAQGIHMTPALLSAVRARDAQDGRSRDTEIWPDMAPAVVTFFALDTQWQRGFMGEIVGLNYAVIRETAAMLGVELDQRAFHDIRIMENETLRVIRSKRRG